ncbi:sugar ABC transporter ATP-binding protein [Vallitalea pronyensis]|uniref:Sugar ABC transporter ATP-binding protein n=1 Tax=Vallitalea pronyensis TaxID=1348613 RepID=A0A8J8MJ54_9FIRM|nr:sugar ABC transporter ATP-binding protein [Vallitalea pronyensis]QUI22461.1 sugar ABC transporter ATP-binding protein [Vallitalea pronyensis]
MAGYILEVKDIEKNFPGVKALNKVNLKLKKGEVHALIGENGAGKSTLMQTLCGIHKPCAGNIYIEDEQVTFQSAQEANAQGISIVYQELSLVQNLTVAENIFANRQPVKKWNIIDRDQLHEDTRHMLQLFDVDNIKPDMLVKELSVANQQIIEILKAMSLNPKILILDEPTSSLTEVEVNKLFENIRKMKNMGITFIYISHHLQEIFQIADRVTILRDGQYVCDAQVKDIDEEYLVKNMVGREIKNMYGQRTENQGIGETILEVKQISRKKMFKDISFSVRAGEIVGFAGLVGAGRTEVGRGIFGAEPIESGEIYIKGKKVNIRSPKDAIRQGIGYMSEDRKYDGLYLNFSIRDNFIANKLERFTRGLFLKDNKMEAYAKASIEKFSVVTPDHTRAIANLSGGNQQKVMLGEWCDIKPKVLIVDEPTRGVDIGAKTEIYQHLRNLAAEGVAVIVISSDLMEVLGISDRIMVMKSGELVCEMDRHEATEENVIAYATGIALDE